ncbi:unnamed protein product [Closterium sp. NIES-64]|nr:unnamed protein product [Closterium sp. NIES-64]
MARNLTFVPLNPYFVSRVVVVIMLITSAAVTSTSAYRVAEGHRQHAPGRDVAVMRRPPLTLRPRQASVVTPNQAGGVTLHPSQVQAMNAMASACVYEGPQQVFDYEPDLFCPGDWASGDMTKWPGGYGSMKCNRHGMVTEL